MTRNLVQSLIVLLAVGTASPAVAQNPLPFGKALVPDEMLSSLPLPVGISFGYTHLEEPIDVSDFTLKINGLPLPTGLVTLKDLTHTTNVLTLRIDAWLLPFLNVYGFAGRLTGTAQDVRIGVPVFPIFPGLRLPTNLEVPFAGHMYGLGTTVAAGYRHGFASYDINYAWVTLDVLQGSTPALTQALRGGFRGDVSGVRLAVYAGAFKESIRGLQAGLSLFEGLDSEFGVKARARYPWNALVGTSVEITPHFVVVAEGGFSGRKQFSLMPGVRF